MATSEYCSCPPRLPTPTASHVAIASGVNHRVTSSRWTSARSYAGQFPTRYFVLYLGCTLDFTSRSCPFGRHDGQGHDEHLFPRTNAVTTRGAGPAGGATPVSTATVSGHPWPVYGFNRLRAAGRVTARDVPPVVRFCANYSDDAQHLEMRSPELAYDNWLAG